MKPIKIDKKALGKFAVTPYNFVSFPEKSVIKYSSPEELPPHNDFKNKENNKLLSGYIEYTLRAETPIIVSSGLDNDNNAKFFVNTCGRYAIPGSTIRGMVRTNAQILSFSNIIGEKNKYGEYDNSEIENSRFLFRDIAGNNSLSEKYRSIMNIDINKRISKNLRSGYITKEGNRYFIEPAVSLKEGLPYIRIDEITLRRICDKDVTGINYMYEPGILVHEEELRSLNKKIATNRNDSDSRRKINNILKKYSREDKGYKPYYTEISFEFDKNKGKAVKIGRKGKYKYSGYILSGGFILGKRSHYIVPEVDKASERIMIKQDEIEAYIDDLIMTKKMSKSDRKMLKDKEFFGLPNDNEKKPVFYINHSDVLHFGFTPYLRMIYSKSVLDGVPDRYKNVNGISYTEALFGFSNKNYKQDDKIEKFHYKSRVSFDDAVAVGNPEIDKESTIKMILAEPKSTSYNLYLVQEQNADKKNLNIYEDDFCIRGFKQYWLKNYIEQPEVENENMSFVIHPLKEGTKFKGRIYFTNLDEEELGLLAWSLKLNDNCYQNIGLAKPYGFGRVKVEDIHLKVENLDLKYGSFSFEYYEDEDINKYIDIYKENFSKKYLNGKNLEEYKSIKELLTIKSKIVELKDSNNYRYMKLEEFRKRRVLPEILNYEEAFNSLNVEKKQNSNIKFSKNNYSKNNNEYKNDNKKDSRIDKRRNQYQQSFTSNSLAEAFLLAEKRKQNKK